MGRRLDPPFKTLFYIDGVVSKAWELFFRALIDRQEIVVDKFTTDGTETEFILSVEPRDENHTLAFVNGTYRTKTDYSISGNKITFSAAPASGWLEVTTYGR